MNIALVRRGSCVGKAVSTYLVGSDEFESEFESDVEIAGARLASEPSDVL